jgi:hypothetical protein
MAEVEYDIRQLVSRLKTAHVKGYLISKEWEEKPSQYVDQIYFQGAIHEGGQPYELYFPASASTARYQTLVMRAIYKLCGIEDREPVEITRDMLSIPITAPQAGQTAGLARLRVRNSASRPLQLRIDSPPREHEMLPGEAIELVCQVGAGGLLEVERGEATLTVRTPPQCS